MSVCVLCLVSVCQCVCVAVGKDDIIVCVCASTDENIRLQHYSKRTCAAGQPMSEAFNRQKNRRCRWLGGESQIAGDVLFWIKKLKPSAAAQLCVVANNMSVDEISFGGTFAWTCGCLLVLSSLLWWLYATNPTSETRKFLAKKTLLVVAHPDDEAMFFVPTLRSLRNVSILCLSTGNYDGLGKVRELEMEACARIFESVHNVRVLEDPLLQDGPNELWPAKHIATIVQETVKSTGCEQIITFDSGGVSGHKNHIDTYHGVLQSITSSGGGVGIPTSIPVWTLSSPNLLRKFQGIIDVLWTMLLQSCKSTASSQHVVVCGGSPLLNWKVRRFVEHTSTP